MKQRALQRALTVTPTELEKGQQQLVLDLSSFGQLYLKGEDTRRFLHNQVGGLEAFAAACHGA